MRILVIVVLAVLANPINVIVNAKPTLDIDIVHDGNKIAERLYQAKNLEHGLSKDFKFLIADLDENGDTVFHKWTPTEENFRNAEENIYVNKESKSAVHSGNDGKMRGVYKNLAIESTGEGKEFVARKSDLRKDYLEMNHTLIPDYKLTERIGSERIDATVELVIVADKEFCDVFGQDYQKILEYFIVLMWDVNLRYKTLPRTRISWQLNGIVTISNTGAQPFIEESRAADGKVEHGRVLKAFWKWMQTNQKYLPPLDIGSVVTNAKQEWIGGLAWLGGACSTGGSSVWNDAGNFDSIQVIAHELGHNLGAPHDDGPNYPGGCSVGSTYIMGGSSDDHRYYFSSCSDRTIGDFVRSSGASCLQTLGSTTPITSTDFDSPLAPSMVEQCRQRHKEDPNAWVTSESCKKTICNFRPNGGTSGSWYYHPFPPLDNSPCGEGNGRCFRGKCREKGYIIKNIGSGLCLEAPDNWARMEPIIQSPCPSNGSTALRRFVSKDGPLGTFLETPYISNSNENGITESLDKCLWTGFAEGDGIWTDKCNPVPDSSDNPWHGWTWIDLESENNTNNSLFLLKHKVTGRCAKPNSKNPGANIVTFASCETGNSDFQWTKYL